jgi:general secretion pathway protein H
MEVLVVLVIIGIVAGVAVLSTASLGGDTPQEKTARHFAALVELASRNAVMESKQFGIRVEPHSYKFLTYHDGTWQPVANDPVFHARHLGDDVTLHLQLEGREIALPAPVTRLEPAPGMPNAATRATDANKRTTRGAHPQIVALSSGRLTGFTLEIASNARDSTYHVRGHMNGKIQLIPPKSRVLNR